MSRARVIAERLFYPAFVFGRGILVFWIALSYEAAFPALMGPYVLASFAILLLAEIWIPYRREWSVRGDAQVKNDLGHSVAYIGFGGRIGEILFLSTALVLFGESDARLWTGIWPSHWPLGAQVVLVIVLGDALEYWYHRLSHAVSWLWPLHVLHHTPDRLHALKTFRQHWLFSVFRSLFVWLPVLVTGAPLELLIWVPIGFQVVGAIAHANVSVRVPRWMHRVLNTPDFHRVHHSIDTSHVNANYALIFPFWDLLFGTFKAPERESVEALGLEDDPVPEGFLRQLALPITLRSRRAPPQAPAFAPTTRPPS